MTLVKQNEIARLKLERFVSFICAKALSIFYVEKMRATENARLIVTTSLIVLILGHGMLIDPARRNSAWKFSPNRPAPYPDNELSRGALVSSGV